MFDTKWQFESRFSAASSDVVDVFVHFLKSYFMFLGVLCTWVYTYCIYIYTLCPEKSGLPIRKVQ